MTIYFTTIVKTADGKKYDLGEHQYPPRHDHNGNRLCNQCQVINAYPLEKGSILMSKQWPKGISKFMRFNEIDNIDLLANLEI